MSKPAIYEGEQPKKILFSIIIVSGLVIFLFFGIWAIALGSKQTTIERIAENGQWIEIGSGSASDGGISDTAGGSEDPSLATTPDGIPIVAWRDSSGDDSEIYVRRWNGTAWMEMGSGSASGGGISDNSGSSWSPSLAIDADGVPIIAWSDDSDGDWEIYVRRWNGSVWVEMGTGSASGGGISDNSDDSWLPSLAIGPDGIPIVAWMDWSSGTGEIYVLRWNGKSWVEMGGSASGGGVSANGYQSWEPSLAIGLDGTPVVAWNDYSDTFAQIYVRRWNGAAWVEMGSGSASGGGISNSSAHSYSPSVAVDHDSKPVISWETGDLQIYVRRWNGTAWVEMGSGFAYGPGITAHDKDFVRSSEVPNFGGTDSCLAIGSDGAPIIAWTHWADANAQIYVRRWTGSIWAELGSGSASGGGISENAGESRSASLTIDSSGTPIVAWDDDTSGNREVYVKGWQPLYSIQLPLILNDFSGPNGYDPNDKGQLEYEDLTMSTLVSGTVDKWTVTVDSRNLLTVTAAPASSADIVLSVLDESGRIIEDRQDFAPAGEVETISNLKVNEPGTYKARER